MREGASNTAATEYSPSSRGGGGGGGGSSSSSTSTSSVCVPDWICGQWDLCSADGEQTRDCFDGNNCGISAGSPLMDRSCDAPVVEPEEEPVEPVSTNTGSSGNVTTGSDEDLGAVTGLFSADTVKTHPILSLMVLLLVLLAAYGGYRYLK
mgnify:CR=1 FL=1